MNTHHRLNRNFLANYCVATPTIQMMCLFKTCVITYDKVVKRGIGIIKWYIKGSLEETLLFCSTLTSTRNIQVMLGVSGEPTTSMISEIPFCFAVSLSAET